MRIPLAKMHTLSDRLRLSYPSYSFIRNMASNWLYSLGRDDLLLMRNTLGDVTNSAPDAEEWARKFSGKLVRSVCLVHAAPHSNFAFAERCNRAREQAA